MRQADSGNEHEIDMRLRQALEPGNERVERIVRKALATTEPVTQTRWKLAAVTSVAVLALLGILSLVRVAPSPPPPRIEVRTDEEPAFHITNSGEVVTVTAPSGQIVAIVAGGQS